MAYHIFLVTNAGAPYDYTVGAGVLPTVSLVYADGTPYAGVVPVITHTGVGTGFYSIDFTHPGGPTPLCILLDADPGGLAALPLAERYPSTIATENDTAIEELLAWAGDNSGVTYTAWYEAPNGQRKPTNFRIDRFANKADALAGAPVVDTIDGIATYAANGDLLNLVRTKA